jgi:hypothetical protein
MSSLVSLISKTRGIHVQFFCRQSASYRISILNAQSASAFWRPGGAIAAWLPDRASVRDCAKPRAIHSRRNSTVPRDEACGNGAAAAARDHHGGGAWRNRGRISF